ncbi:MAG TPA: BTAD domain-containing putative transcriptional regulator [Pseudonocardiaceae bacterium]|nr:BTAD domain-containing putative transcriptional regulator [Pseudonocardiaceae bacterium]
MNLLILGPVEVHSTEGPVRIGGVRQQTLLGLLVANLNRTVSADRITDELWERPPDTVRQQIHNAVSKLRQVLSAAAPDFTILTTDIGYRLAGPADQVDAHVFRTLVGQAGEADAARAAEQLRAALGLWRDTAMLGLTSPTIDSVVAGLAEQRLTATEQLMALRLRLGESTSAVGELRELVGEHPFRESLRGHLMVALHRAGRPAEALAVYDEGRRLLADELGLDPGETLRALHAEIITGGRDAESADEVVGQTRTAATLDGRPATRSYLPPDPADFSGRTGELSRLAAQAGDGTPAALVISAIDGMGGVGKTTLAVRLAHQLAPNYPDGQYFVDLHGFTRDVDPVPPEQALGSLLLASGVPNELIPPGADRRLAMWRAQTAGQRALVVLDNAADAAQARSLLPGSPGVLVIVTSRRKLTALAGARSLSLDVLPEADAVALFTVIAGDQRCAAEPAAVADAVRLCGGLPLAIRIAAARLRDRQGWRVADLVTRLADQRRRGQVLAAGDQDVTAVLTVSYHCLDPRRQRLFRLLSLHPGTDVDAYSAAALTGEDPDEAERLLESLLDDNLLRQDVAGRYYFHDLVRDCARQLGAEHDGDDARARLLDYYVGAVHTWASRFGRGLFHLETTATIRPASADQEAVANLAAEYANLGAVLRFAAEHGWHRHAWQLACSLQPYLWLRGYDEATRQFFEWALESARADGDTTGQTLCLLCLTSYLQEHGSFGETRACIEQVIELSRGVGDSARETAAMLELGFLYLGDDQLVEAYRVFRAAEDIVARTPGGTVPSTLYGNLGAICKHLGRFDQALDYLRQALERERDGKNSPSVVAQTLWNTGMVLHLRGDHAAARPLFEQTMRVSEPVRFHQGEGLALTGLASVARALGDFDTARELGRQALDLAREWRLHNVECHSLLVLGETAFLLGRLDRARQVFEQAERYARQYGVRRYVARAHEGQAHVAWLTDRVDEARDGWERAIELYSKGTEDINFARRHLAALGDRGTVCFRCTARRGGQPGG